MYKALKLRLKDCKKIIDKNGNQIGAQIIVNENMLKKCMTLVKESEIIRIVRTLGLERNDFDLNGFTYIKDLISLYIKIDTYRDVIKSNAGFVNITFIKKIKLDFLRFNNKIRNKKFKHIHNRLLKKYNYKSILFKRLMSSSGNVRNKKVTFVRSELFDKVNEILLCGLPKDMEHPTFSKFNSYYAMASTDSVPVKTPKFVVIDDYKKKIKEVFDLVREKDKVENKDYYKIEEGKNESEIQIIPFDGAGLVDVSLAERWKKDLELDYLPSSWQFRAIPGIKGNVYTFDLKKFSKEFKSEIKDIFGQTWDLFKDNINMILTKSQFKFYKQYKANFGEEEAFETWQDNFNKELHGYKKTFNISKYSEKNLKHEALLSYQPIQSLQLSDDDIKDLCSRTVKKIEKISTDVNEFLKYRGIINAKENEVGEFICQKRIPSYYKALKENPDLFYDNFIQKKVKKDIAGFEERTLKGCIFVKGNYQTLIPDIFALAQYTFGLDVTGGLKANTVYSKYWIGRYKDNIKYYEENMKDWKDYNRYLTIQAEPIKIDVIRFPHISNEHFLVTVVDKPNDYYKYMTEGIVTSINDSLALHIGGADFDNDHVLTTNDRTIVKNVEQQKTHTIVPVPKKKAMKDDSNDIHKIDDMNELIETDIRGMSNDIGKVVNKITQLWSIVPKDRDEADRIRKYIKIMSVVGSKTIDFAKTGEAATIPYEISKYLKDNNIKKPYFQRVIYKKEVTKEKSINANRELYGEKKELLFSDTDCTMNKLCYHMESEIKRINDKFKNEQENKYIKDFTCFYYNKEQFKDKKYDNSISYKKYIKPLLEDLKKEYDEISREISMENSSTFCNSDIKQEHDDRYKMFYTYTKIELVNILLHNNLKLDRQKLLDFVVFAFYQDKEFNTLDRSILWNCFGNELIYRIKGKKIIVKKYKLSNDKKLDKIENLKKSIAQKNNTYISKFANKNNKKEVEIFDSELNVFSNIKNKDERNMLKSLYIISKFNEFFTGTARFKIEQNKKSAITKTHICKLARINVRDYPKILKKIINKYKDIVTIDHNKNFLENICVFNKDKFKYQGKSIKYKNINECRNRFK